VLIGTHKYSTGGAMKLSRNTNPQKVNKKVLLRKTVTEDQKHTSTRLERNTPLVVKMQEEIPQAKN